MPAAVLAPVSPAAGPGAAAAPSRQRWADVAKGACILLVVLWHVVEKQVLPVGWRTPVPVAGAWSAVAEGLLPLRMPLFFTISGLLAVRSVARPWPVLLRTRVASFAALYVLWVLIQTALLAATPGFDTARATGPLQLLAELTISPTNLWYLLALALYLVVAKASARVPAAAVLGAALVLSAVASAGWIPNDGNRWQVLQNLVFFLAGVRLHRGLGRWARDVRWQRTAALGALFAVGAAAVELLRADARFGVHPALSVVAVLAGIDAAVLVARRCRRTGAALAWLGRRTLPVYVLHMPLLAGLAALLAAPLRAHRGDAALVAVLPLLVTAAVVAFALLTARLLRAARLGRLLDPMRDRAAQAR